MTGLEYEVEVCWARLRRLAELVALDGDPAFQGHNWGKRALAAFGKHRARAGIDIGPRVLWWDATIALTAMYADQPEVTESVMASLLMPAPGRGPKGAPRRPRLVDPLRARHPRQACRERLQDYGKRLLYASLEGVSAPSAPLCVCEEG